MRKWHAGLRLRDSERGSSMALVAHALPMSIALNMFSDGSISGSAAGGASNTITTTTTTSSASSGTTVIPVVRHISSVPGAACDSPVSAAASRGNNNSASPARHHYYRQPSSGNKKRGVEDEVKRSRQWATAYELSQDLHDKQLEMLERKYGGHARASHAAKIIQRAYRNYCMTKNFAKLRTESVEKRLSRRLAEFSRSKTIWTDMVVNVEKEFGKIGSGPGGHSQNHHRYSAEESIMALGGQHMFVRREDTSGMTYQHVSSSSSSSSSSRTVRVMQKSHSLNTSLAQAQSSSGGNVMLKDIRSKPVRTNSPLGLDLSTIQEGGALGNVRSIPVTHKSSATTSTTPVPSAANNNRNSYPEMNDSSASNSPQDTPVEPAVDLPSVNFENLLESKETDILNDSFHSDSSQEAVAGVAGVAGVAEGNNGNNSNTGSKGGSNTHTLGGSQQSQQQQHVPLVLSPSYSRQDNMDSMEDLVDAVSPRSRSAYGVAYEQEFFGDADVQTEEEDEIEYIDSSDADTLTRTSTSSSRNKSSRDSDPRTPQDTTDPALTRIYCDTEVRLRPKKGEKTGELIVAKNKNSLDASPIWKRKSAALGPSSSAEDVKRMSNISEGSEGPTLGAAGDGNFDRRSVGDGGSYDGRSLGGNSLDLDGNSLQGMSSSPSSDTASLSSHGEGGGGPGSSSSSGGAAIGNTYHRSIPQRHISSQNSTQKLTDRERKRAYRIGLNLFNKKPEKGIRFLFDRRFLDPRPAAVARFLITRKGLSKQMIGEYLGNIQNQFNMDVLHFFAEDIDLAGLQVDMALRKFQSFFRTPGEAQKIERLMQAFAHRYVDDNPDQVKSFHSSDTVFLLAYAIIMLNTDLHNNSVKAERKMKLADFIKNLRGIDNGKDIDPDLLTGIYDRIRACEFKPGADHVTQVMKVEQMIVGKKPASQVLALPHRRLVCYCRLYEVHDPNKREKLGLHQREVFLFNDVLLITKIFSKKKNQVQYSFRQSYSLCGMLVYLFETAHYKFGIRLTTNIDGKVLMTFNARNEHDRSKFVEDLKEAIFEINEMESLRIDEELAKQRQAQNPHSTNYCSNRHSKDSGVVDIDLLKPGDLSNAMAANHRLSAPECEGAGMKKNTLSNSLGDLTEVQRRGSGGSLDSGMASTSSACSASHEDTSNLPAFPVQPDPNHCTTPAPAPAPASASASASTSKQQKLTASGGSRFGLFGKKSRPSKGGQQQTRDSSEV